MPPIRCVLGVAALLLGVNGAAGQSLWHAYVDPTLGYRVSYPAELFGPPAAAEGGAGQVLISHDGRTQLTLLGGPDTFPFGLSGIADHLSADGSVGRVTYRKVAASWLVLSGYLRGTPEPIIFYEKMLFSADRHSVSGFRIEYPASQRAIYDPLIGPIQASLRAPLR